MRTKPGVLIFLLAATLAHAQTNHLTTLLQQGLFEEQANHNLDAAIADYQSLAAKFGQDRKLAATAIFRLGECYRMQGKTNEATAQYQRILREFPDEKTLATLSRQNLTALGAAPSTATPSDNSSARLWQRVKNLPEAQLERILPTLAPDPVLTSLLQQRNEAETKLAKLQNLYGPQHPDVLSQKSALAAINKQITEKINGIMEALKLRAELAQPTAASSAPTDAEDQEIQRIQRMIQNSPDLINRPGKEGTPLQKAAWHGWLRVATFLLDHGADVNAQDPVGSPASQFGSTALGTATLAGNRAMVELLLRHGADINAFGANLDNWSRTPLQIAVAKGFQAVAKVLLANKADVNAFPLGGTALFLSAQKGRTKISQVLLAAGASPNLKNKGGDTPLSAAVQPSLVPQATRVKIVKLLLGTGANPNVTNRDGRTPLSYAADGNWNRRPEVVKLLLTAKANPNGGTLDVPLLCAIHNREVESANLLLQAGADPNAKGKVDWKPSWNYYRVTLSNRTGNYRGWATPLWLAVDMNQLRMVQLLLKYKADPNASQTDDHALVFDALPHANILKALLDAGANPNKWVDRPFPTVSHNPSLPVGYSPLGQAIVDGNAVSVRLLLAHGARLNSVCLDGMTPLLGAIYLGVSGVRTNIVELLLKAGAKVNARDEQGNTPLHYAARHDDGQILALLLAHKANPNVRNNAGQTPLDIVKSQIANRQNEPGRPGTFPPTPVFRLPGMANSKTSRTPPQEIEKMLLAHGALENLPDWNSIEVTRPSAHFKASVFHKSTNDWNHFTLLDLVAVQYQFLAISPAGQTRKRDRSDLLARNEPNYRGSAALSFPDLAHLHILRPSPDGKNWRDLPVDLKSILQSGNCTKDVPLQWGDVVEIPETDHPLNEQWRGFSPLQLTNLMRCLTRQVGIVVKGRTTAITLAPSFEFFSGGGYPYVVTHAPFWIEPVLRSSNLLLTSSDLSRVKVIRRDPKSGKRHKWILNCSNPAFAPDFWLRNGDVIEVPEK